MQLKFKVLDGGTLPTRAHREDTQDERKKYKALDDKLRKHFEQNEE